MSWGMLLTVLAVVAFVLVFGYARGAKPRR